MFDDLYPEQAQAALQAKVARPPEPPAPRFSLWGMTSAVPKGAAAGTAQAIGSTADTLGAFGSVLATTEGSSGGMFSLPTPEEEKQNREATEKLRANGPDYMSEAGRSFRNVAHDYTPDPLTAHTAEKIVFDVARVGTKAVAAAAAAGPIPGAVVAGAEEGFTQSDELAQQGVDLKTRTKVGGVTAAITAVSFALPVAGKTAIQTAGLALAGGPVSFMAQNAANKAILNDANYSKLANQYDPFDPMGLALSTIIPMGFGALAMRGAKVKGASPESVPTAMKAAATDEAVDAARTSLLRESIDTSNPTPHDLASAQPHADAHARAIDQLASGERVSVAENLPTATALKASEDMAARVEPLRAAVEVNKIEPVRLGEEALARLPEERRAAMVDMYTAAAREKPAFDAGLKAIADDIGGSVKLAELKGATRTVDKVLGDYGGDPTKIKDLVRGTIVADTPEIAQRAVEEVLKRYEVLPTGRRNLLEAGSESVDGYRDAKFNVLVNGHVAEIQVNVPAMLAAKKEAHPLYKEAETLRRKYEGEVAPPKVLAEITALKDKQRAIYAAAWEEATKDLKASSEIKAPLRTAESDGNTRGGSVSQAMENGTPGQSGLRDTGTPSTSSSSALGPKAGSDIRTSDASIVGENANFYEREVSRLATENPELMVMVDGMDAPKPISEVMAMIKQDLAHDLEDANLIQVAAECFLSTGMTAA